MKSLMIIPISIALSAQTSKPSAEAETARQSFQQVLNAVANTWFGKPYQDVNAVDLSGTMSLSVTPQALNAQVDQLSQGQAKGQLTKGAKVNLALKGTYFANGDFRTDLKGDFGNLLYTRIGERGFLYSVEQNAYTTRIDPPPVEAPLTYLGWFRQVLNEIKAVYVDGTMFKASLGKEDGTGGKALQTVIFSAPTTGYDAKKREQDLKESLGFWRRGRLEVTYEKATRLPRRLYFDNEAQGVTTRMEFVYGAKGLLQSVNVDNQSRGVQGPASLRVTYDAGGLIDHVAGQLSSPRQNVVFDIAMSWAKGRRSSSILTVPPPGATKKGGDEMKTLLAVGLAGRILDLQRKGLNLRSVTLTN